MAKIDILHVYAGTSGSKGLYIDSIYNSLKKSFKQEVIVSAHFPFTYGKKWFYKYSDLSTNFFLLRNNYLRLLFRFYELIITLLKTFFFVKNNNISLINYGLTSDLYVEYIFFKAIKFFTRTKIIVTCHDVLPFGTDNPELLKVKVLKKKKFLLISDFLLVHNKNSRHDLEKYYDIKEDIFEVPFPVMDLNLLNCKEKPNFMIDDETFTIGMIGNLRREKGVDVLIKAWNLFYKGQKNVELIVAGHLPKDNLLDFTSIKTKSTKIIPSFIDETTYKQLLLECDVIILPYKRGTNSGIPSSIISSNTIVLASNIPMFKNNELIVNSCLFETEKPESLSEKISWLYNLNSAQVREIKQSNRNTLLKYKSSFEEITKKTFKFLIDK